MLRIVICADVILCQFGALSRREFEEVLTAFKRTGVAAVYQPEVRAWAVYPGAANQLFAFAYSRFPVERVVVVVAKPRPSAQLCSVGVARSRTIRIAHTSYLASGSIC